VKQYLLATRSTDKAREIRQILAPLLNASIVTLADIGLAPSAEEDSIESLNTFRGNAVAKAAYFRKLTQLPTVADDSGLEVMALGGAPGVRSRRFSGRSDLDGRALDQANNDTLLARLADIPPEERVARYMCVAALIDDQREITALGSVEGVILDSPRGTGGFGYDPLFFVPALDRTFAEISGDLKNLWSHRGRAFRGLAASVGR
jgi:XTP/dITP diphosphohydrolase